MGWSEWITGTLASGEGATVDALEERGAGSSAAMLDYDTATAWANALANITPIATEITTPGSHSIFGFWVVDDVGDNLYAEAGFSEIAYRFTADPAYKQRRDWFPAPMYDLIENVDYTVRPGKDPYVDDDAYVEFQPGDSTLDGWGVLPVISGGSFTFHSNADEIQFTTHPGHLTLPFPAFGVGSIFAQYGPAEIPASGTLIPDPGPLEQFSVTCRLTTRDFAGTPPVGETLFNALLSPLNTQTRIVLPPWRYWKPGDPFLWNAQRTDALGGRSAGRGRGATSTQASPRNRGGIH